MAKKFTKNQKVDILKVDNEDRMALLLLSSEMRALQAEQALARAEFDHLMVTLDKDGKLQAAMGKFQGALNSLQFANQKYTARVNAVEKRLGFSMNGFAMDPETGVVRPISLESGKELGLTPGFESKPNK